MGLMCQHYFGTKRGNYYMMTSRQFTARQMLEWGMVNEVLPKGKVLERAWEIARMWKTMPYENRTIMSNLAKRPLKKLLVEDLKLHTVSEQYGSLLRWPPGIWVTRIQPSRTRSTSAAWATGATPPETWRSPRPPNPGAPCPRRRTEWWKKGKRR